jgi:hypothetical protein
MPASAERYATYKIGRCNNSSLQESIMFKSVHSVVVLALLSFLWSCNMATADVLVPTAVSSSSSIADAAPELQKVAGNTIDGSGLFVGPSGILGAADSNHYVEWQTMWMSAGAYTADYNPSITYNLGSLFNVSALRIWNYNEYLSPSFSAKDVEVFAGTNLSALTSRGTIQVAEASGTGVTPAQDFTSLDLANVQYVKLAILSNWDGAVFDGTNAHLGADGRGLTGLSEFRAEGTAATPEPSTLVLLVLGAASLLCYAWKTRK